MTVLQLGAGLLLSYTPSNPLLATFAIFVGLLCGSRSAASSCSSPRPGSRWPRRTRTSRPRADRGRAHRGRARGAAGRRARCGCAPPARTRGRARGTAPGGRTSRCAKPRTSCERVEQSAPALPPPDQAARPSAPRRQKRLAAPPQSHVGSRSVRLAERASNASASPLINVNGIRAAVRNGMSRVARCRPTSTSSRSKRCGPRPPTWPRAARLAARQRRGARQGPFRRRDRQSRRADRRAPRSRAMTRSTLAGRWIEADFDLGGEALTVVSAYVPTGEAGTPRQDAKWRFLDEMECGWPQLAAATSLAVVTGDLNVGHREFDIRNWKGNVKKAGFLPRERAYFDRFLGEAGESSRRASTAPSAPGLGWVDVGRTLPRRGRRPLHVVVEPRQGVRQRHRLAHRLPPRDAPPRGAGHRLPHRAGAVVGHALERPRPGHRRLHARGLSRPR